jgi:hypothetical protein
MDEEQDRPKWGTYADLVREFFLKKPKGTYQQAIDYVRDKTGHTIERSQVYRAKITGINRIPRPKNKLRDKDWDRKYLAQAMSQAVTLQDILDITRKLVELAKGGNLNAWNALADRLWGKPKEHIFKEERSTQIDLRCLTNEELDQLTFLMSKGQAQPIDRIEYKPDAQETH